MRFDRPIDELHAAYGAGMAAEAIADAVLARHEAVADPGIFIHLASRDEILAQLAALGPFDPGRYPLWGVPFAVKDNIDVAGMPTTAACPAYAYEPATDATVVARLKAAGAIVVGKTNLDQFATGLVGVRTPYPVPLNALDPDIVPGGSSSGSAVAVAHGIATFSLGTDTAGSGRVPAALNDIVGLKPSIGALSATGVVPACRSLDCVSIFAASVEDAFRVFAHAAAHDPADPWSRAFAIGDLAGPPGRFTVGVPRPDQRLFFGDTAQEASYGAALALLEAAGADIVEIDFAPFFEVAALLYEGAWVAERYAAIEDIITAEPDALHEVTRGIIGGATRLTAVDAFRGLYRLKALAARLAPVIAGVDLLAVPTIPNFVSLAEIAEDPIGPNSRLGTYTNFVNLLDLCGIAVPTGARGDGRPGSVTLLAPAGADGLVASVARAIEGGRAHAAPPAPAGDGVALAVVGAHLTGMPLNGELTGRGARFLEETATAAAYRLFALPGQGLPRPGQGLPRPGLLRVGDGEGAAVALELWSLAPAAFGALVAAVPPPLSIGTVTLADGREVKGFLVEAAATERAEDITSHGGWRAYMAARPAGA